MLLACTNILHLESIPIAGRELHKQLHSSGATRACYALRLQLAWKSYKRQHRNTDCAGVLRMRQNCLWLVFKACAVHITRQRRWLTDLAKDTSRTQSRSMLPQLRAMLGLLYLQTISPQSCSTCKRGFIACCLAYIPYTTQTVLFAVKACVPAGNATV